jgi:Purple acid Phosphatase, N-terminal domain
MRRITSRFAAAGLAAVLGILGAPHGFTPNPDGRRYRDLGFGNFLRSGPQSAPDPNSSNWLQFAPTTDGQFQVVTVRDVAMTPPQCPTTEAGQKDANGNPFPYFQKGFFIFRMRMDGLTPSTTYYYKVTSMGYDGVSDGVESSVHQFTTADPGQVTSAFPPPQ